MPRLAVVANAASGTGPQADERRKALRKAFLQWGADPPIACVPGPDVAAACRQARADGADVVVAAGGDGTVSCAAGIVAGTTAALAVLPLGTLNHFAKDARLPLDLDEAARVALQGRPTPLDAAQVNGQVFVNNASIGVYPSAVDRRERIRPPGGSKPIAMARAAAQVLRQVPAHHVHLTIDGRAAERTTSFVFVGNNAYATGLADLGTRPSLREGRLSLYTLRRPGRRALLGLAARSLVGRLDQARDLDVHTARNIVLDCRRPALRVGIDGEVRTMAPPLRFAIHPGALRVVREAEA